MASSLRLRLLLPLVAVAIPLIVLTVLAVRWDQARHQREAGERATAIAETANIMLGHALVGGENLLDSLDGHARLRDGGPACSTLLFEIRSAGQRYASIGVADAHGTIRCASPPPSGQQSIGDRGYFQQALATDAFAVGDLQLGRLSGVPTIAFARPTSVAPGGVLFASIDLNWLAGLIEPLALREDVSLLFVDGTGALIASANAGPGVPLDPLARAALAADARGANEAALGDDEYVVGLARLHTQDGQVVGTMVSAVPLEPIVAASTRTLLVALSLLGATAAGGTALALLLNQRLIIAPIQRLSAAAAGISDGRLDVRLHEGRAGEIGALERALDEAAEEVSASRRALAEVAYVDPVAGTATRQGLERVADELRADGRAFAVMYLTLVGFHELTATFGYPAADAVLRTSAERLSLLPDVTVGRVGGNAFAVLLPLPEADPETGVRLAARRMVERFEEPMLVGRVPLRVRLLLGAAIAPTDGTDFDLLLRRAEVAARSPRSEQTDVLYDAARHEPRVNNVAALAQLQQALDEDRLELHYQPVVDLRDGVMRKVEALLRWPSAPPALRSPGTFIPLAERSGMIGAVDRWVVDRAVRQAAAWAQQRTDAPRIAVNVSAHSFQDPGFPDFVDDLLVRHEVRASALGLEITETALVTYFDDALDVCRRLAALGLTISVDDFGIGHSPVLYLRDFPVSEIKVDRSLVQAAPDDARIAAIVRALSGMAAGLGVSTVAEGVETDEQRELVRGLGCEFAQGWFFARALPPEELIATWSNAYAGDGAAQP